MAFDRDTVLNWPIPAARQVYTPRDTMLYALGIGMGHDPCDEAELPFVQERGLRAFPAMAAVLAHPGFWMRDAGTGIDWTRVLHAEQSIRLLRPLAPGAAVTSVSRVVEIADKGEGRGALLRQEREVRLEETGELIAAVDQLAFCRGDGGCGGPATLEKQAPSPPARAPDHVHGLATLPQAALIYRLSGDYNPLHSDPAVARRAGFERPILQGLCTMAVALRSVLGRTRAYDTNLVREIDVRFVAPVYPGERIRTEIWDDGDTLWFRAHAEERDTLVLNNGRVVLGAASGG
ncbi:MaoC/PaaZ C-terminal domain-containing protein [Pinisolibacter aquiterrae]|uniref:MaoC/PaaZ C-terminal domain-containing protein n=1 Tax=Pinisolibacter aquiterrae TaxID=2815579 RepID=UPI001C3CE320|nr:MaoC/PaaZ C-terminal domain-containing protein [Pinisolibacter aquiterrae]MBV5266888.1 MaoC family dehydratase N-terminal domain-containing protein [Pinisolibacter aquiterrae]MCC8234801.1 MaoC family dehydratase N-terminal domain-containing protein [Pinisolibacter aquiterrae]